MSRVRCSTNVLEGEGDVPDIKIRMLPRMQNSEQGLNRAGKDHAVMVPSAPCLEWAASLVVPLLVVGRQNHFVNETHDAGWAMISTNDFKMIKLEV